MCVTMAMIGRMRDRINWDSASLEPDTHYPGRGTKRNGMSIVLIVGVYCTYPFREENAQELASCFVSHGLLAKGYIFVHTV